MSTLVVTVLGAKNVPNIEKFSKSDPLCEIEFKGTKKKTKVIDDELNPVWNETFEFDLKGQAISPGDQILIRVMDHETIGPNRLLGSIDFGLQDLIKKNDMEVNLKLSDANKKEISATLDLRITYKPPANANKTATGDGGNAGGGGSGDAVDGGGDQVPQALGNIRGGSRHVRPSYSTKPQDFQIRVKILKARQLHGSNVSPVCRIMCWNQLQMTRVQKSTNSPFWNETFFFNFHHSPAELFEEFISFSIYDSRLFRADALIGSFKFDIGSLYEADDHCYLNKWLLLSDVDDVMAGPRGYLKFCAVVLGPGDDAPSFKSVDDDDKDIEKNLLRPAGVQLRPATFRLKLYHGEDLPRMDSNTLQSIKTFFTGSEPKELVDAFLEATFAGKEVKSSTKYNSMDPVWNEELQLALQFPSMCQGVKLQLYDWDRLTANDPIGAFTIRLDEISSLDDENGFLPTFGPCFINLYGSPREFSDLPDEFEALNYGKGEGVAYRGRLLVELATEFEDQPQNALTELNPDTVQHVQKFLRRRKYKLYATFLSASMVADKDAPVEFEVSIGNYGNTMDEYICPSSSATQPTNAVFDGQYYHFLPWSNLKPCTVVECHWEDISFRLFAINYIRRVMDRLRDNIAKINVAIDAKLPEEDQAQFVISAFDDFIICCGRELPKWEPGQSPMNQLDKNVELMRREEFRKMKENAMKFREEVTSVEEALNHLDTLLQHLNALAIEPQNSIPDVIIWMISGDKRIAYYRIPAYDVLWAKNEAWRGRYCGDIRTISLVEPSLPNSKNEKYEIPAQLRVKIWLAQANEDQEWMKTLESEGELAIMAETYENEVSFMGNWCTTGPLMTRPDWSDSSGRLDIPKDKLKLPDGWQWVGDWKLAPEISLSYDLDAGLTSYVEDVFVNESRLPGAGWEASKQQYTNASNEPLPALAETPLPDGWEWADEWAIDFNKPCDEEGWEYSVEAKMGGYVPTQKMYHMSRRRRFIRSRRVKEGETKKDKDGKDKDKKADKECWEYAVLFNRKYYAKEKKMHMVRRRRWHRQMKSVKPDAPLFFNMGTSGDDEKSRMAAPRMFLSFKNPHKWQLRAYIFQARDLLSADQNGLSDPYARVAFLSQSQVTERIEQTVCPCWDQTLIFESIDIYDDPKTIAFKPPNIVVEFFDFDKIGEDQFIGRCEVTPIVKLSDKDPREPVLLWYPISKMGRYAGELLAAFQLHLVDGQKMPPPPPRRGALYSVPQGVRPVMQRTGIEILSWGVRNMGKYQLLSCTSPSIDFEIGGHMVSTDNIKNTHRNPNFDDPFFFLDVLLPKEQLYMPPMNIKVRDHRQFGRKPMVGLYTLKKMDDFFCQPLTDDYHPFTGFEELAEVPLDPNDTVIEMPQESTESTNLVKKLLKKKKKKKETVETQIDWWSKYYASIGEEDKAPKYKKLGYDLIEVYDKELEKVEGFDSFNDFCCTLTLSRGKNLDENDDDEDSSVGEVKAMFKVYPLPEDRSLELPKKYLEKGLPDTKPLDCVVRVYIIKAFDLQPKDANGLADPFVKIKVGKKETDNKDDYVPNCLSPVFGRMFELKCTLPMEKDLQIRVMDYDLIGSNDVIGETFIDLENRYLSKFRATAGLPQTYCTSGPNLWRDSEKPSQILNRLCEQHYLPPPEYDGNASVKIGGKTFTLASFEKEKPKHNHLGPPEERLALHLLNRMPLVREHVETRPLYNPIQPGIEQGKVQMWVDLFPTSMGAPGPIFDVRARRPNKYELRIIIWNTKDVVLDETSITGEKMSDIFVKGWISGIEEEQKTDVHYRSMDGEGNFNWRFVFPFEYMPSENCLVVRKKEHFWSLDTTEHRIPPKFVIQIWDNDLFSPDEFLGTVELDMHSMASPQKSSNLCSLDYLPGLGNSADPVNLFEALRSSGFWPCYRVMDDGTASMTGKVEMEIELLTEEEALQKPAGQARDDPNSNPHLDPPKRPETSFFWLTSPWKTFKFIIWKKMRFVLLTGLLIVLAVLLAVLFIYAIPGLLARKMIGV